MDESKCFACGRALKTHTTTFCVFTTDGQFVAVGPECYRKIVDAHPQPWQPPKGGPRLQWAAPIECG